MMQVANHVARAKMRDKSALRGVRRCSAAGTPGAVKPARRRNLLELRRMRLEGIQTGDIVEVDRNGRRFHAIVTGSAPGGLSVQPTDRRVNYYTARSREVVGHWAKRGRPRPTAEPLKPSPRQLEMDLLPAADQPGA